MKRRAFISLVGATVAWPIATRAQQAAMPVIGFLSPGSPRSDTARITALRQGLNEAGYIVDRNVTIEYRSAGNQVDLLAALAADLVQHRVKVIVTAGPVSTLAAKAATATVPIVFAVGNDPVQLGLVGSIHSPGGNLTGSSSWGSEIVAKGLEVLHELLPATVSVGFLANPRSKTIAELQTIAVLAAGRNLGVDIQTLHASTEDELNTAFAKLTQARTGALLVSVDYLFNSQVTQLVALAARYAVPTLHSLREFPVAGGLMSYGGSLGDIYRLAGLQVARILKGEKPADLPVVQSTKLELIVNLKTAKTLSLTIPPSLLARRRSDRVTTPVSGLVADAQDLSWHRADDFRAAAKLSVISGPTDRRRPQSGWSKNQTLCSTVKLPYAETLKPRGPWPSFRSSGAAQQPPAT